MFVCSVKSPKAKGIAVILVLLLLVLGFVVCSQLDPDDAYPEGTTVADESAAASGEVSYSAADAGERLAFIDQFGWKVKEDPVEIAEVIVPETFDEVYEKYNTLQIEQGLDLTPYQGKRVKRWTYEVTNYPGHENSDDMRLHLLIADDVVIGGDVCCVAENGFMHGFSASTAEMTNGTGEN